MEIEGLIRAVEFLHKQKLEVGVLVTDRHRQIAKWVRENLPSVDHRFDVWHLAKGISDFTCCDIKHSSAVFHLLTSISKKS